MEKDERNFSDIVCQESAKRALMIAVAGNHPAILLGPPGSGKSMLAGRVSGIMPSSDKNITFDPKEFPLPDRSYSDDAAEHPFRCPHHTISDKAFSTEMKMSERGVFYLDEYVLFKEKSRTKLLWNAEIYCSTTMLIAGDHFCECGYFPDNRCSCSRTKIDEKRRQFGMDSYGIFQMWIPVAQPVFSDIEDAKASISSEEMKEAVDTARRIQDERYEKISIYTNAELYDKAALKQYAEEKLGTVAAEYLKALRDTPTFTDRDATDLLRIARTVADISGSEQIKFVHLEEAYKYIKAHALSVYKEDSKK